MSVCAICDKPCSLDFQVAMYEGKVVDTALTDEWAGMPVHRSCLEMSLDYTVIDDNTRARYRALTPEQRREAMDEYTAKNEL